MKFCAVAAPVSVACEVRRAGPHVALVLIIYSALTEACALYDDALSPLHGVQTILEYALHMIIRTKGVELLRVELASEAVDVACVPLGVGNSGRNVRLGREQRVLVDAAFKGNDVTSRFHGTVDLLDGLQGRRRDAKCSKSDSEESLGGEHSDEVRYASGEHWKSTRGFRASHEAFIAFLPSAA